MPCRRRPVEEEEEEAEERLLLAAARVSFQTGGGNPSVVGAGEVDALVAKLGQVLQLNCPPVVAAPTTSSSEPRLLLLGPKQQQQHRRSRAAPYSFRGAKKQLGWRRPRHGRRGGGHPLRYPLMDEEDPHRLLQELILSGNLIKEAVRRLQRAAEEARSSSANNSSSSSASSSYSGTCSSEGDAAI